MTTATAPVESQGISLGAMSNGDPRFERIKQQAGVEVLAAKNVAVAMMFQPDLVSLDFVGERHVPTLRVEGDILSMQPQGKLPLNIAEITFDPKDPPRVTMDYEFSVDQLKTLIDKGLYLPGFMPPVDEFTAGPWVLGVSTGMELVAPDSPGAPPLLSVDVDGFVSMEMDQESAGFDVVPSFPDYAAEYAEKQASGQLDGPETSVSMEQSLMEFEDSAEVAEAARRREMKLSERVAEEMGIENPAGPILDEAVEQARRVGDARSREDFGGETITARQAYENLLAANAAANAPEDDLDMGDDIDLGDLDLDLTDVGEPVVADATVSTAEAERANTEAGLVTPAGESLMTFDDEGEDTEAAEQARNRAARARRERERVTRRQLFDNQPAQTPAEDSVRQQVMDEDTPEMTGPDEGRSL